MKTLASVLAVALGLMAFHSPGYAQERIKVLADAPLRPALNAIAETYRRDTGRQVEFVFGPSPVIHKRVADGETADVLVIQPDFVASLIKSGKVVPGDHPIIGRVGIGLAARADSPVQDIGTVEAFRQALLNADSLIFNTVASGNHFATVLERLGIADSVKAKLVRLPPGAGAYERVIQGKGNDLAVGTISIIKTTKGVRLIGPLPPEFQTYLFYAAAPMSGAASPEAATTFITFLASSVARALFIAHGVE
jgi:molybdate transport system substrate-binding protein